MFSFIFAILMAQFAWSFDVEDVAQRSRAFYTAHKEGIKQKTPQVDHDYYKTLTYIGFVIKTTDDISQRNDLETLLLGMLHTGGHWGWSTTDVADDVSTNIFKRAAYAAFVARPDFVPQVNNKTTAILMQCKDDATPKLGHNVCYVCCPELEAWMVLEKLTKESLQLWLDYSSNCDAKNTTSVRYQVSDPRYKFVKEGMYRFIIATLKSKYYIAYLAGENPSTLYPFDGKVPADKIRMLATVHADDKHKIYTPFGITRTFEEAARRVQYEKENGKDYPKPSQPESVFFHSLLARLVSYKFSNVQSFWTVPLPPMQTILLQATHPDVPIQMMKDGMGRIQNRGAIMPLVRQKERIQIGGEVPEPKNEWTNMIHEQSSNEELRTTIPVDVMVRLLYPH